MTGAHLRLKVKVVVTIRIEYSLTAIVAFCHVISSMLAW